jgi:hypothetical protein
VGGSSPNRRGWIAAARIQLKQVPRRGDLMTNLYSAKRLGVLVFAALAVAAGIAAYLVQNAKADGRTLDATFCASAGTICMQVASDDGTATGEMGDNSNSVLSLRPGVYWLTVTDTSNGHDFVLRSCPGEAVLCDWNSDGQSTPLTPLANSSPTQSPAVVITKTFKINLKHGTYRLYCDQVRNGVTHEMMGMAVDLLVGGVGQVGSGVGGP